MEEYKNDLCRSHFLCLPDAIVKNIRNKPEFKFNLNENGNLHSDYVNGYYEPAIIRVHNNTTYLYWLFDGKIVDCEHPFHVSIDKVITEVEYFSSSRIRNNKAINMSQKVSYYNLFMGEYKILDEYKAYVRPNKIDIELTPNNRILFNNMML